MKDVSIIPEVTPSMSPMMRQYIDIKSQHEDAIVFFRLGDFYEMFYNDAEVASDELDLVLTERANGEDKKAPMCGVPYHSCESYIARLVAKGYRVAIAEQTEDPSKAKTLVRRAVVRVITPGTVTDDSMLEAGKNNYLLSAFCRGGIAGVCFVDFSTGELHLTEIESERLGDSVMNEAVRFSPKEALINEEAGQFADMVKFFETRLGCRTDILPDMRFIDQEAVRLTLNHFGVESFNKLDLREDSPSAAALAGAMRFLYETQKTGLEAINQINLYTDTQYMRLDVFARNNLELTETIRGRDKKGSLLWVLDHTRTPMGKRLIRNWMELPLLSCARISERQNAVEEIVSNMIKRDQIGEALKDIKDLERLMTRILYGTANAKELNHLAATLEKMPRTRAILENTQSRMLGNIYESIHECKDLCELIRRAIVDEPPFSVREGEMIRDDYNTEVDKLREIVSGGQNIVLEIEAREQERTGIKKLKIKYNRVFGYCIEIPNASKDMIPEEYIRKQTLANCERYITDEVKQLESRILGAKDKLIALEYKLFVEVREAAAKQMEAIRQTAHAVAELDTLWSLSFTAAKNKYVRPDIVLDGKIQISDGRHPVVERLSAAGFVPNDTTLDIEDNRCAIITGPNMAGKSTYMRQTALITLMAQIGSFVPAKSARIGIVDAIFTRVGASDDLASGQSTFMTEMTEMASILKHATNRSLLILDEIGRGTSTYDGMSIARAVLEYVADKRKLGAKTLFATHYHELTALEELVNGVKNFNIAAKKKGDNIVFLRRIVRGGADDSYGIEVAQLAGVPNEVISRAKVILKELEAEGKPSAMPVAQAKSTADQVSFSSASSDSLIEEIKRIDANTLSPIEALTALYDIVNKAKEL